MNLRKGLWSPDEDEKILQHIAKFGHGCWSSVAKQTGLQRSGKSCRFRWVNYLRPNLKRGEFSLEEENLIIKLQGKMGNRWARIAKHLPGRTDNDVKNLWNASLKKKVQLIKHIVENQCKVITEKQLDRADGDQNNLSTNSPASATICNSPGSKAKTDDLHELASTNPIDNRIHDSNIPATAIPDNLFMEAARNPAFLDLDTSILRRFSGGLTTPYPLLQTPMINDQCTLAMFGEVEARDANLWAGTGISRSYEGASSTSASMISNCNYYAQHLAPSSSPTTDCNYYAHNLPSASSSISDCNYFYAQNLAS